MRGKFELQSRPNASDEIAIQSMRGEGVAGEGAGRGRGLRDAALGDGLGRGGGQRCGGRLFGCWKDARKEGRTDVGGADGGGRRAFAARGGVRACMLSGARVAEGSADGCGKGDAMAGCRGAKKVRLREAHATAEMGGVRGVAAPCRSRFAESRSLLAQNSPDLLPEFDENGPFCCARFPSDLPRLNGCLHDQGKRRDCFSARSCRGSSLENTARKKPPFAAKLSSARPPPFGGRSSFVCRLR